MLLDPFEKQLDLPPASIQVGDGDRRQREVVGQEHPPLAGLGVFELDAARWRVEVLMRVKAGEHDGLIANQPGAPIDWARVTALGFEVGFGARHKEAARLVQAMQPLEVDNVGMLPRRSSSVCNLIAALVERNGAQENTDRHRSMVLASGA